MGETKKIKDKTREVCDLMEKLTSRALGVSGTLLDMSGMDDDTVVMLRDTMKCVKELDELLMMYGEKMDKIDIIESKLDTIIKTLDEKPSKKD